LGSFEEPTLKHHELYVTYDKDHCWQYDIRKKNEEEDRQNSGLAEDEIAGLQPKMFDFGYVPSENIETCREIVRFIERHEWLGKMPNRPTHRFTARYKGKLAGVIIMAVPNTISKMLGEDTFKLEKLISRGACISWSPKNLNSWLVMNSIRWMISNTEYRAFTAYSDPEARELGSIYQGCNFLYIGQGSGTVKQYLDPNREDMGWFSDRHFRHKSMYKKYAANLGISASEWKKHMKKYSPDWDTISTPLKENLKSELQKYRDSCKVRVTKPKHKYVYIKGRNKNETKKLRRLFQNTKVYPYPKNRGE